MPKTVKIGPFRIRPHIRHRKVTGYWQLDVPPHLNEDGKRRRLNFSTKSEATNQARQLLRRMRLDEPPFYTSKPLAGVRLWEVAERWTEYQKTRVRTRKKRASSLESDLYRLKSILAILCDEDVAAVDESKIDQYQEARLSKGRSAYTVNSEVSTLLHVLKWAKRRGFIRTIPEIERLPARPRSVDLPTPEEVARIVKVLPSPISTLLRLIAETGCRKGEAFHLTWNDVDEVNGLISVRSKEGWTPKNTHSERRIAIGLGLSEELHDLPKRSRYVFPGCNGNKPLTNFTKALASAVEKAGVMRDGRPMHLNLKMLRKVHATWQKLRGLDDAFLQPRLGHARGSKITATSYIEIPEEELRRAILELPMSANKGNEKAQNLATSGNTRTK